MGNLQSSHRVIGHGQSAMGNRQSWCTLLVDGWNLTGLIRSSSAASGVLRFPLQIAHYQIADGY
jgi:hypothetical protein